MSARVLVAGNIGPWKTAHPPGGMISHGVRRDLVEHRRLDADRGDDGFAAMNPAGHQRMTRLAPEEGDSQRRLRRDAAHPAAGAVDAARDIDGDDGGISLLQRVDDVA